MKVFVTGLAGAAGSALVKRLLQEGHEVAGLDIVAPVDAYRLKDVIDQVDYQWKSLQDMTPNEIIDTDVLAHFSAQANTPLGLSAPRYTVWENLDGLINLLECARKVSTLKLLIYPSSGVVFGRTPPDHLPIKEDEPLTPSNPYAATKACSEILCLSYLRCYNVPVTIIRIGMGFGPGMRKDESIAQFIIKTLKRTKTFWVESPGTTRDPSYLENVLDAWMQLLEISTEKVIGEVFHISSGIEISIIDLAKKCAEIAAKEAGISVPSVGVTHTYRRGEFGMRQHLDISKAKRVLGWEPKISLEEGLRRTAKWLIEEGY